MKSIVRQQEIMKSIVESGFISVSELSSKHQVSEVTIRSDLRVLEQKGLVERRHGGAASIEYSVVPFPRTTRLLSEKKEAIAVAALTTIKEGDTVFLDDSSTIWHFALQLHMSKFRNITVISNSIPIFEIFKNWDSGTLIGIPGTLSPNTQSFGGPFAIETIKKLRVNKAYISPKAILPEGLRDSSMMGAELRKCMIESAAETIILADYSKFMNGRTLFGIDNFDRICTIVTDQTLQEPFIKLFEEKGIKLVLAAPI